MIFQLIFPVSPALAHHTASVGKSANQLNSPETYVNLGQAQLDFGNALASIDHHIHHQTLIPSELTTQQVPITQPAKYGNVLTTMPLAQTRLFSNFGNVQLSELPLVNAHYKPYIYNAVPY